MLLTKTKDQKSQITSLKEEINRLKSLRTYLKLENRIQKDTIEHYESGGTYTHAERSRPFIVDDMDEINKMNEKEYSEIRSLQQTIEHYRSKCFDLQKQLDASKSTQQETEQKAEALTTQLKQYRLDFAHKTELESQAEYESREKWKTLACEKQETLQCQLDKGTQQLSEEIGRAVQQECRDRSRMPSSA
eukprot:TRINITY_DN24781_c0_g1_i2.p1 TRINITY_DN24781_c0_g1~~TRINITY_DN24781_c0_g1_i2.p1  ORF type:complete len:190 (-),score=27.07 TRINITY_DN24781_c0_g1_i2:10-579(-)